MVFDNLTRTSPTRREDIRYICIGSFGAKYNVKPIIIMITVTAITV